MRLLLISAIGAMLLLLPTPSRGDWACHAREQWGRHVLARLDMRVESDGTRQPLAFEIAWQPEPGPDVSQQMNWFAIPPDATRLWKPDAMQFGIPTRRTARGGSLVFEVAGRQRVEHGARRFVRPLGHATWVEIEDPRLLAQLWSDRGWTVEQRDARRRRLGSASLLLPPADAAQSLFNQLRARIEEHAADPSARCEAVTPPEDPI